MDLHGSAMVHHNGRLNQTRVILRTLSQAKGTKHLRLFLKLDVGTHTAGCPTSPRRSEMWDST